MGKLLFWFIIVLVVLTVARIAARAASARERNAGRPRTSGRTASKPLAPAEQMVRCAHCGIHLPRSEATMLAGDTYCSQEHARLGVNRG